MSRMIENITRLAIPLLILAPLGAWQLIEILIWIGGRLTG